MTPTRSTAHRHQCGRETTLDGPTHLDDAELAALDILRFFFVSYSEPQSQGWRIAFTYATACFGRDQGVRAAYVLMELVETISRSRRSLFTFSNPRCQTCRLRLSEPERQLMHALSACRAGDLPQARRKAMMLSEGAPVERLVAALVLVAREIDAPKTSDTIDGAMPPRASSSLN